MPYFYVFDKIYTSIESFSQANEYNISWRIAGTLGVRFFVIIFRYFSKEVLATLLATTLILLIIFITNQFVHYLSDAADGKITTQAVMKVMSLQVPLLLGYLLPLSLFLGLLLTLGRLYVDHEMVVLSSCGVSRAQVIVMVMWLATIVRSEEHT